MSFDNWTDGLTEVCSAFQADLSCLVDGELTARDGSQDSAASARAMLHIESCPCCRDFVEDTRRQVQLHRDMADPDRLLARVAMLTGSDLAAEAVEIDLNHRLATIFYQLGKAYALAGIDIDSFRERVFEAAVPVDSTKSRGRGFVDGVLMDGHSGSGVDWERARHLLNGRLEKIAEPLDKGRRLLEEAVAIDPDHEEARHYLALIHKEAGRSLRAAEGFREVFDTALVPENRVHAANQLGRVYHVEGEYRKAIRFWRWGLSFGNVGDDERFWFLRFNVALAYVLAGDARRAVAALRTLLDRFPARAADVTQALAGAADELRGAGSSMETFTRALVTQCPELFLVNTQEADES